MRKLFVFLVLALFGGPVAAQDSHPQFAAGLEAYEFFCSKCHGKDMVNPGVSSYDLRKFPRDQKDRFYSSVRKGKGDMPAWGDVIYPEELDALWVYVATRGGTEPFPDEEHSAKPANPVSLVRAGYLTACLSRNAGVLSGRRAAGGSGFDFRVGEALAQSLGLDLDVVWVESEPGEESDPVHETYAMLAYGLCDMVPSHPLYSRAVGVPPTDKAALPRWLGMPEVIDAETQRRINAPPPYVDLEPIAVTKPYMRAEIGLAYVETTTEPKDLADVLPRRLAYQQGTLSGALLELDAPTQASNAKSFNPGPRFLWQLESGAADVAIVDVAAFDAHRHHNSVSRLRLAKWRHRVGMDIGIAVLEADNDLKQVLDTAISTLHRSNRLVEFAEAEGVTYSRPQFDGLRAPFTWRSLRETN
ncbi:c-type cytochrome [uncultured Roseobacter sp.]|uniref:c-type cytochrome n=1 Tax=uncultured Roseobacter sp. TaxID=114847 RepID=UPI0026358567|nr:c-type cytochrome [uncultured Roseobacter sp.]